MRTNAVFGRRYARQARAGRAPHQVGPQYMLASMLKWAENIYRQQWAKRQRRVCNGEQSVAHIYIMEETNMIPPPRIITQMYDFTAGETKERSTIGDSKKRPSYYGGGTYNAVQRNRRIDITLRANQPYEWWSSTWRSRAAGTFRACETHFQGDADAVYRARFNLRPFATAQRNIGRPFHFYIISFDRGYHVRNFPLLP